MKYQSKNSKTNPKSNYYTKKQPQDINIVLINHYKSHFPLISYSKKNSNR